MSAFWSPFQSWRAAGVAGGATIEKLALLWSEASQLPPTSLHTTTFQFDRPWLFGTVQR